MALCMRLRVVTQTAGLLSEQILSRVTRSLHMTDTKKYWVYVCLTRFLFLSQELTYRLAFGIMLEKSITSILYRAVSGPFIKPTTTETSKDAHPQDCLPLFPLRGSSTHSSCYPDVLAFDFDENFSLSTWKTGEAKSR
jgi:hypothetical protein